MFDVDYSDLLGKPFVLGGRGPDCYDCVGLCMELRRRAGLEFIDVNSPEHLDLAVIDGMVECGKCKFVRIDKPQPWCVVTFKMKCRYIAHIGLVLPGLSKFIHTRLRTNVIVERLNNEYWHKKIDGFYEYRKID